MPNTQGISERVPAGPHFDRTRSFCPLLRITFQAAEHGPQRSSMDRLVICGGKRIEGSVQVCGAKNAALPQIAAALLSAERLELTNVPDVTDVDTMLALMREIGVVASRGPGRLLVLDASGAR